MSAMLLAAFFISPTQAPDGLRYLRVGQRLWHWFVGDAGPGLGITANVVLYPLPGLLVAGGHRVLGPALPTAFVLSNIALFSAAVYFVFRVWATIAPASGLAPIALGVALFLTAPDLAVWSYYLLPDTLFLFLVAAFLFHLTRAALGVGERQWTKSLIWALLACLARPPGYVILGYWAIAAGTGRRSGWLASWRLALCLVVLPTLVALVVWPTVLALSPRPDPRSWPFVSAVLGEIDYWYLQGAVVCSRPETYLPPPVSVLDFMKIAAMRLVYFYYPLRGGYSMAHNALSGVYFAALALAAYAGWRRLRQMGPDHARLASLLVAFSYVFGLFHSMTELDYDWRYQLPAVLAGVVLAGVAFRAPSSGHIQGNRSDRALRTSLVNQPSSSSSCLTSPSVSQ